MVTGRLFLAPLIAGLSGRDPRTALAWQSAELVGQLGAVGDRETFVRARRSGHGAEPMSNQDSGSQKTLADADVLIRRPAGAAPKFAGSRVDAIDL
jgi:molybdopterin molybdotransferase